MPQSGPPTVSTERLRVRLQQTIDGLRKENARLAATAGADTPAARGRMRCLLAALLISLSFIGGILVADLSPETTGQIQGWFRTLPSSTMTWLSTPAGMATLTGAFALLILATLLLSGMKSRVAFLPSTGALMAAAAVFGTVPVTNSRALEGRVVLLEETVAEERARAEFALLEVMLSREKADGLTREHVRERARLNARIAEAKQEAEDALKLAAFKDDIIRRRDADIHRTMRRVTAVTDKLAVLEADYGALRETLAERDALITRLQREREEQDRALKNLQLDLAGSGR